MNKLIFCPICADLKTLRKKITRCVCGKAIGLMIDHNSCVINELAIPVGLSTKTFQFAIANRPDSGLGTPFTAFVMPNENRSVVVLNTKELVDTYGGEAIGVHEAQP